MYISESQLDNMQNRINKRNSEW